MLVIPAALQAQFEEHLRNRAVPNRLHGEYKKWLRYYLDFCVKYHFSPFQKESLPRFIHKLQEKKQSKDQQGQAADHKGGRCPIDSLIFFIPIPLMRVMRGQFFQIDKYL